MGTQPCLRAGPVLAAAATMLTAPAQGANWDWQPRLEAGGLYNDNYRLDELKQKQIKVGGIFADAELDLHSITTVSDIAIEPRIHSTYFPGHTDQQSTDGFLGVLGNYRTTRQAFGGLFQYANQNVIYSELPSALTPGNPLGQPQAGGSGRVTFQNRQQLERLAPSWTYDWTNRRRLHVNLDLDRVSYDHSNYFEQVGFRNFSGVGGLEWGLSQRTNLVLHLTGARFLPNRGGSNTTTYGADGQWNWSRSQVSRVYVRLGVSESEAQLGGNVAPGQAPTSRSVNSTGFVGGTGIQWTFPVTQLYIDAMRSLEPSAFGVVLTQNELRFTVNRALRPRLRTYAALRAIDLSGAQSRINVQNRDYVAGEAGMAYDLTQELKLTGNYVYTRQHFQHEPFAASNAVSVSIVWQPLSRYAPLVPGAMP